MQKVYIYLENGTFLEGCSFGANKTAIGKLVYNNATFGYQEVITDPSNAGLFINFMAVEIGNSGTNKNDMESSKAYTSGVIVRNYHDAYSNYRAEMSLADFLKSENVMGICDIDTRFLTKIARDEGSMMMIASTEISSKEELAKLLKDAKKYDEINFIEDSSTKDSYIHKSGAWDMDLNDFRKASMSDKKVVVYDFGAKKSFLNELVESGLEVEVIPFNTKAEDIIEKYKSNKIGGVVLSSGAGNPNLYKNEVENIRKLVSANLPILAVGLGHYLLALANGAKIEKINSIKSGSHPIKGEKAVELYSLNTQYAVKDFESFANSTYTNVFTNNTVALKYKNNDILSSEFTPISNSPIYKEFSSLVK
ncbi:carbamoyl phosphate synthase small subunit [Arcobacter vandammei]|uniref:carbamoyl phosphate synthase small subunit n=1 Tax=Arcobacter vandammei TaxID=2782243 RepID=UPI0018DF881A|nr:carbamoyl phosphate synthase small subunit [Arcobacter vandammei]